MYVCADVCMYAMYAMYVMLCMYVCMYVHMYVYMYVCMYVHMYVYMYVCMYVCMYISMSSLRAPDFGAALRQNNGDDLSATVFDFALKPTSNDTCRF